ncbi:PIN domain-containing protein [Herbaspirillum sp. B65]|jgi:predicted nucleic acid-binding protein|uniref:PIN domain-containing protein n=1 Tax=Herbaspirillum sp. B65 TaxID=137708 RepID=UPI000348C2FF|nr:PIN domain-containing protein [Herbaspirillum sp. B65]
MAGFVQYTAILDACVLYPAPLRDLLLHLAEAGRFQARWSAAIHDEWTRNLLHQRPEIDAARLMNTVALMNASIEDCMIEDYQFLIDSLSLPDPDDRHVLAAAIVGHADAIVTFNLKDFPRAIVGRHAIEVLHPDDFLLHQYDLEPVRFLTVVKELREGLKRPVVSAEQLVRTYERQGLLQIASRLSEAIELI